MEIPHAQDQRQAGTWAMVLHLSQLAGYIVPVAGWVVPIVIWQIKKTEIPSLDPHGKVVANWILSALIYAAIAAIFVFVLIGIPVLIILGLLAVVFPIIGAIKANDGVVWKYPLSITFFR